MHRFSRFILFSFLICNHVLAEQKPIPPCKKEADGKISGTITWDESNPNNLWGKKKPCGDNFKSDVILFYQTLFPKNAAASQEEHKMLKRLILWMAMAPLQYKTKDEPSWKDWPYPLAVALAHGGRMMILKDEKKGKFFSKSPEGKDRKEIFFGQLLSGQKRPLKKSEYITRAAASHGVKEDGEAFVEQKLGLLKTGRNLLIGVKGLHRGYNIAFGGVGNLDQCCAMISSGGTRITGAKGDAVLSLGDKEIKVNAGKCEPKTGEGWEKRCENVSKKLAKIQHGHFYIQPFSSDTHVGLLIGLEQSAPGKYNANGEEHNALSGFKNSSEDLGLTGGYKMPKLFASSIAPQPYGGMQIILTEEKIEAAEEVLKKYEAVENKGLQRDEDEKEFWKNILLNNYTWNEKTKKLELNTRSSKEER